MLGMYPIFICKFIKDWAYNLQDSSGHIHHSSVADVQLLFPV